MNLFIFLKDRLNIIDIIKDYVAIKRAGIYYKGPCPFHHEKDASFTVSPHKGIFYCFGCHASGDAISFIAQIEGCGQLEAAKLIIDKYNIEVPQELLAVNKDLIADSEQKNRYYTLCQAITQWLMQELHNNQDAQTYITKRSVSNTIQKQYELGYFSPENIKSLQRFMQKNGFLVKDLIDNHILIDGPNGIYSPFEDRIIFPIFDHLGRCCGFGGRVFKPHDERAKYYNSRENSFFNKSKILFGLHNAKRAIQKSKETFLVEGYFDCIAMAQYGYPNSVATLGTACSSEHLKIIAHYTETLNVIFDGDNAGLQAMLRLTQLCWNVNINIRIICLPKNEDPASFLTAGGDLTPYIAQAKDIFDFFISHAGDTFKQQSLKGKLSVVRELLEIIDTIDDRLKQTILLKNAAEKLEVPYEVLVREKAQQKRPVQYSSQVPEISAKNIMAVTEKKLFVLILENPSLLERTDIALLLELLPEEFKNILSRYKSLEIKTCAMLMDAVSDEDKKIVCELVITYDTIAEEDPEFIITNTMQHYWKNLNQKIKEKITQANEQNDPQKVTQLLEHLQELKKKMVTRSLP